MLDLENVQFFVKQNNILFWGLLIFSIVLIIGHVVLFKIKVGFPLYYDEEMAFASLIILSIIPGVFGFFYRTTNYAVVEVTQPKQCIELLNNQLSDKKFKKEGDKLYFLYTIDYGEIDGKFDYQRPMTSNSLKEKIQEDFDNEVFKVNFKNEKDIKFLGI